MGIYCMVGNEKKYCFSDFELMKSALTKRGYVGDWREKGNFEVHQKADPENVLHIEYYLSRPEIVVYGIFDEVRSRYICEDDFYYSHDIWYEKLDDIFFSYDSAVSYLKNSGYTEKEDDKWEADHEETNGEGDKIEYKVLRILS